MTSSTDDTPFSSFSGVPAGERGRKRGLFGRRSLSPAVDPSLFADEPEFVATRPINTAFTETPAAATMSGPAVDVMDDESFVTGTPAYAARTRKSGMGSAAPLAIAAGLIVIGGIAAAGWYATQPHDQGVAELTPGGAQTATSQTAASTTAPDGSAAPTQVAENTPPPVAAAPPEKVTTRDTVATTHTPGKVTTRHTVTTTRSPAASDTAADASTTAPVRPALQQPAPAPAAAPPATPAPPLVLNVPPAASPSAPVTTAPAVTPPTTEAAPQAVTPPPTQTPPTA